MPNQNLAFFSLQKPYILKYPVLISVPHSGRLYPYDLLKLTKLPIHELRKSEDSYVDILLKQTSLSEITLLKANLARIFCDLNRGAWELDPSLFKDPLPNWCKVDSIHVKQGIGTVHKISSNRKLIYKYYLPFKKVTDHINNCWLPYHEQIQNFITQSCKQFSGCIILDIHSMPSARKNTPYYADIVLGDGFAQSCSPWLIHNSFNFFNQKNLIVKKNIPYAGGYITRHYGNPHQNIHSMQIELNKSIYMDENLIKLKHEYTHLKTILHEYIHWILNNWHHILT